MAKKSRSKHYVDEMLDFSGVEPKSIAETLQSFPKSDADFITYLDDLFSRATRHYGQNMPTILSSLTDPHSQPKAFCFTTLGSPQTTGTKVDALVRKLALYYDKALIQDPFLDLRSVTHDPKTSAIREAAAEALHTFVLIQPWVAAGIVELVPRPSLQGDINRKLRYYAIQDSQNIAWQSAHGLAAGTRARNTLLRHVKRGVEKRFSRDLIERADSLDEFARRLILCGTSLEAGNAFLGALLTHSSPTTDDNRHWRLLELWLLRRSKPNLIKQIGKSRWQSFARELKAGRAWLALEADELGVLSNLSPEQIAGLRSSSEYSVGCFREDLGDALNEIEQTKLDDEKAYREVVERVWEKVRDSAKQTKRDMTRIRNRLGREVGLSFMSISLGLLPFEAAKVAAAILGAPTLKDLVESYSDIREHRKSLGYFLLKLKESH